MSDPDFSAIKQLYPEFRKWYRAQRGEWPEMSGKALVGFFEFYHEEVTIPRVIKEEASAFIDGPDTIDESGGINETKEVNHA